MWFSKNPDRKEYEGIFTGPKKKYGPKACKLPRRYFQNLTIQVGELVRNAPEGGLLCEVPRKGCRECGLAEDKFCYKHTDEVDVFRQKLIKSKKRPLVLANEKGTMCLVVSHDKVVGSYSVDTPKTDALNRRRNAATATEADSSLQKAIKLHESFHGVPFDSKDPKPIKKIDIEEPDYLVFFGWLKHIIYDVPKYSERRGVPFIHEGQDRGDDKPKAREKPYVCISPKKDYLVIYGSQFEFTERGMIG